MEAAKKDWSAAKESGAKAVAMLKATRLLPTRQRLTVPAEYYLHFWRGPCHTLFVTKVDQSQTDLGVTAYQEYIAVETDPV